MILSRVAGVKFSQLPQLLDGLGAARGGGRWNPHGLPAVYLAELEATAVAEKAFYSIIIAAVDFNASLRAGQIRTLGERGFFADQPYVLSNIEFEEQQLNLADISTDTEIARWSKSIKLNLTFQECIHDKVFDIQHKTQEFARLVREHGHNGLIVPSARHAGNCIVLFPDDFPNGIEASLRQQNRILISGLKRGSDIKYDPNADGPVNEGLVLMERMQMAGDRIDTTLIQIGR